MKFGAKIRVAGSVLRYLATRRRRCIAVAWLITGRCNMQCVYCKWKALRASRELDTAAVCAMIDQMRRAGVLLLSFTGGEPLLREDMGEIIRYVKRRGLVCKLNTNGALVEARLDALRALDILQISLDGMPSVQDGLRGAGTGETALRAIRAARGAGIGVQVIACLTRANVAQLDELLAFGVREGLAFCFQLLSAKTLAGPEAADSVPDRDALVAALRRLYELKRTGDPAARAIGSSRGELAYYLDQVANARRGCDCALVTATMLPDGRLIFCGSARDYETYDAVALGFAEAFNRLSIPACDGCVCVGKLRLSKLYQLDLSVIRELLRL